MMGLQHPSDEVLMSHLDGELSWPNRWCVSKHLERCWSCRGRLESLSRGMAEFLRHREKIEPAPPALARRFTARLHEIDRERADARWALGRPKPIWITALLTLAVMLTSVTSPPAYSAVRLFEKAVEAEQSPHAHNTAGAMRRRLSVRRRTSGENSSAGLEVAHDPDSPLWSELNQVLVDNGMDLPRPLAAAACQRWRASVRIGSESVREVRLPGGEGGWVVETVAQRPWQAGRVQMLRVTLRANDWQPVETVLAVQVAGAIREYLVSFFGADTEVVSSLPVATAPVQPAAAALRRVVAPKEDRRAEIQVSKATALDLEESSLEIEYLLHRSGDCLQNPFEVSIESGAVAVHGVAPTVAERDRVRLLLADIPYTAVDLALASEAQPGTPSRSSAAPVQVRGEAMAIQEYLAERLGSGPAIARLSNEAVTLSQAAEEHSWALRRLAERYPAARAAHLSTAQRALLQGMVQDHAAAVRTRLASLGELIGPLLIAGEAGSPAPELLESMEWQPCALELFRSVRRSNGLTLTLFADLGTPRGEPAEALRDLTRALRPAMQYASRLAEEEKP